MMLRQTSDANFLVDCTFELGFLVSRTDGEGCKIIILVPKTPAFNVCSPI